MNLKPPLSKVYIIFIKHNFAYFAFFGWNNYVCDENHLFFYKAICSFCNNTYIYYCISHNDFADPNRRKLIHFGIVLLKNESLRK